MNVLERKQEEAAALETTTLTDISDYFNIRHLENREQYISHLEDLLLIYSGTIQNLTYMLGE